MPGNRRRSGLAGALGAAVGLAVTLAGCAGSRPAVAPITLTSAFVFQVSGFDIADGYLVIQNTGPADRLTRVSSSVGGAVLMSGPARPGSARARTVTDVAIPAHSTVRLDPTGMHLVLTHLDPMQPGSDVTLTLVFARAGRMRVAAQVSNPQTDNSGYFGL